MFLVLSEFVRDSVKNRTPLFFREMVCSSIVAFLSGVTDINLL